MRMLCRSSQCIRQERRAHPGVILRGNFTGMFSLCVSFLLLSFLQTYQRTPRRLQYNLNSPAHFCASREVSQKSQWTISKVSSSTEWIWMPIAHPHPPRPSYNRRKPDPDSPQDWPNRLLS